MIKQSRRHPALVYGIFLAAVGLLLNVILSAVARALALPLYLDNLGTVLAAVLGGPLPGIAAGLLSNVFNALAEGNTLYYCLISALTALIAAGFHRREAYRSWWKLLLEIVCMTAVSTVLSTVLTWALYAGGFGDRVSAPLAEKLLSSGGYSRIGALSLANLLIELLDKAVTVALALIVYRLLPGRLRGHLQETFYPIGAKNARRGLLKKVTAIILTAEILLGALACAICYYLYNEAAERKYTEICRSVTQCAALLIDPERVSEYIELGEDADGYAETERLLYGVRDSFPDAEYLYCYRMEEDGCRVVFDLDTEEVEGGEPGQLQEFDESFDAYLPTLLSGGEIDPIITNDTYGWLLTVYRPLRDSSGACVCYVCADVNMTQVMADEASFLAKMAYLFFGLSILIMAVVLELVKLGAIKPLNAMAGAASGFAYDSDEGRSKSLEHLESLDIRSRDEIGNLYESLKTMARDSATYIQEIREKSEQITNMQAGIISDFAEMVEARDQCTGDHIKNTSHYVEAIARELMREGKFPDRMTEDYVQRLVRSSPLHDVGKIKISDVILNKPGRLTDEEFETMKTHTTEGRNILTKSSSMNDAEGYLREAVEMANYHHERWDGKGYPTGAAGEDIPLSARIMAVADVFDALVSQRSYKKGFSFEQATEIIREESGTHFDPAVAEAFLRVARQAYDEMMTPAGNTQTAQPPQEEQPC